MTDIDNTTLQAELENENPSLSLRETIDKYIYHWPLFLIGLSICLLGAYFYLRYTEKVYVVNSTLLIKDDKSGAGMDAGNVFNDIDLFSSSKVVDNEIEILKSKTLMHQVVDRLNLMIQYNVQGRIIDGDVYVTRPVTMSAIQIDSNFYGRTLTLRFPSSSTYLLQDAESGKQVAGQLNKLQRNAFGIYKIIPTHNFGRGGANELQIQIRDPFSLTDEYLNNLSVTLAGKSTVLNLSLRTTVPQRGKDVLNTLIQVYNEAALADKNKTTQSTIQFIDERLKLISGELMDVEKNVETFKSNLGLTDISSEAQQFLDNVQANDIKLNEVELKINTINEIQRYVNSPSQQERIPSTLGVDDPVLLSQINQLATLQLERDKLLATTTIENPLVEPLLKQIETTRSGIRSNIENIRRSLISMKSTLQGNNAQFQGAIKKIPGQDRQFISIKRQQTIKESLYLYLLQKKEEAALSYASAIADSRTVDPAFYSRTPIQPKRQIVFLGALLVGLILPASYIYGKGLLNNKVNGLADISKISKIPVLGEVMYVEDTAAVVITENSREAISEQFRAIRTNMEFLRSKSEGAVGRITLFTSSMSGEGKSFVSTNIAAAFAISGKKTVILELDLRKPQISKTLNLDNRVGLSNYLIGRASINDIIKTSSFNHDLFVIGSGPIPPNPSELLIHNELDELMAYLKKNFDEILIDAPPIGLVTDAQILARFADATIYLMRQNYTFKAQVKSMDAIYRTRKMPNLNAILNGIKYGGNYGYGYGYGYYSDDIKNSKTTLKSIGRDILNRLKNI
jgi:tyrosine-protein kinase Etk/Wzc